MGLAQVYLLLLQVWINETFSGIHQIEADVIISGRNVTNQISPGDVRFENGRTVLKGNTVELQGGTSVQLGAELEIRNRTQ